MMKKYDYLVVGSGLYGAVFAREAKKAGKSVLVIDKRPNIAGNVYTEDITKYAEPISWEAHFGESYFITITGDKTTGYKVALN